MTTRVAHALQLERMQEASRCGLALEAPRRRALLSFVQANPGVSLWEAARSTGIPKSSAMHHVTILKRHGLLQEFRQGRDSALLALHHQATNPRYWIAQRDPNLNELLAWIRANPNPAQKDALDAMARIGWSRSTTQHRLRRLVEADLVVALPRGRTRTYRAVSEIAPPFEPQHTQAEAETLEAEA